VCVLAHIFAASWLLQLLFLTNPGLLAKIKRAILSSAMGLTLRACCHSCRCVLKFNASMDKPPQYSTQSSVLRTCTPGSIVGASQEGHSPHSRATSQELEHGPRLSPGAPAARKDPAGGPDTGDLVLVMDSSSTQGQDTGRAGLHTCCPPGRTRLICSVDFARMQQLFQGRRRTLSIEASTLHASFSKKIILCALACTNAGAPLRSDAVVGHGYGEAVREVNGALSSEDWQEEGQPENETAVVPDARVIHKAASFISMVTLEWRGLGCSYKWVPGGSA